MDAVGAAPGEAIMVGDDLHSDVLAAQRIGVTGVLVRTGKYRPGAEHSGAATPDHVIDSIADLPGLLARLRG